MHIRQLFRTLAPYLYSLRRMIELHPAIFTFSAWSAPNRPQDDDADGHHPRLWP
jgi:hypothetical protein